MSCAVDETTDGHRSNPPTTADQHRKAETNVIQLTRLRHGDPFYVNPDLLERVDTHVDTVIRLTTGSEYVVSETGDEIVRRIADYRARIIALAGIFQEAANAAKDVHDQRGSGERAPDTPIAELEHVSDLVGDHIGASAHAGDPS